MKRHGGGQVAPRHPGRGRARDPASVQRARRKGLKEILTSRDPGDWIDDQIADVRKQARVMAAASG